MTNPFKFLRAATPYVRALRGKVFVVKIGGELLEKQDVRLNIFDQIALLQNFGIRIVVVHGGGPQIAKACEQQGLPVEAVNGRRITSPAVLETVMMVLSGSLQSRIVAEMRNQGLPAAGISGIDAELICAQRRPPVMVEQDGKKVEVDFGEVGDIEQINPEILSHLVEGGFLPVVAPLGCDNAGAVYNINADTVAAEIAKAIGAEKLICLMTVRGILSDVDDPRSLISELNLAELSTLETDGTVNGGMLPKLAATRLAIEGGVKSVHLVSGVESDALLQEIFTNEGSGTMVVDDA